MSVDNPTPNADFRHIAAGPVEASRRRRLWRRIAAHGGLLVGVVGLGLVILIAVFAPLLMPHDPYAANLLARRIPPVWYAWFEGDARASWVHPLGTDQLGRDYLSRLLLGARVSLTVAFFAVTLSGIIGTVLGVTAGYFGRWVDAFISFIVTTRLSMPVILVALAVVSIFGSSLFIISVVLGFLLWDRFAVVIRSATLQLRDLEYITAAKAMGCSTAHILFRQIGPNILSPLIVVATLELAVAILLEASLSFLGLGVQPPEPSWGLMLSDAKADLLFDPWLMMIPGLAIFFLVFVINLVGDGIRDVTAPEGRS